MRFLFFLVFLGGILAAFVYPSATEWFSGDEIGTYKLWSRTGEVTPVEVGLKAEDAPVRVNLSWQNVRAVLRSKMYTVVNLDAVRDGKVVLDTSTEFMADEFAEGSPNSFQRTFTRTVATIDPVDAGSYQFVAGPGTPEQLPVSEITMTLRARALPVDDRVPPAGYAAMAFGFVGFIGAVRSNRRRKAGMAKQAAKPRWGRDAGGE